jgi:hypothetical protein
MSTLNSALRTLIDLVQAPLAGMPPLVGIALWSVPVGVFALWIFKKTSNQRRIAAVKAQIHACLFEIRLFNDDLRAILRAQGEILRHVVHYQGLALIPMVFILPPLVLLMVQLHAFYGFRGLRPGTETMVTVAMEDGWTERFGGRRPQVELELPDGLEQSIPAVWVPELGQMSWLIGAGKPGDYRLAIRVNDETLHKSLRVTDSVVRLSPTRPDRSFLGQLEWPSERPLPESSGIREITVGYPEGVVSFAGWRFEWSFAWMVVFFVLTMIVAVVLKGPMRVEL